MRLFDFLIFFNLLRKTFAYCFDKIFGIVTIECFNYF